MLIFWIGRVFKLLLDISLCAIYTHVKQRLEIDSPLPLMLTGLQVGHASKQKKQKQKNKSRFLMLKFLLIPSLKALQEKG